MKNRIIIRADASAIQDMVCNASIPIIVAIELAKEPSIHYDQRIDGFYSVNWPWKGQAIDWWIPETCVIKVFTEIPAIAA